MNKGREFDLLVDLSRLLKKYEPEVFDRLAEQLSAPEFLIRLGNVLSGMARNGRAVSKTPRVLRPKTVSLSEFRLSLVALRAADSERGELLLWLYDALLARTVLPRAPSLRDFIARTGLGSVDIGSRPRAAIEIIEGLRDRPLVELQELVADLKSTVVPNDRGLEGWTRIILGEQPPGRKAQ